MDSSDKGYARAPLIWAALVAVYIVWGSTYLAIRVMVETFPPFLGTALRALLSAAIMATILLCVKGRHALRVTRPQVQASGIVGILLIVGGTGLVAYGEQTVPSGLTALLIASVPLMLVMMRLLSGDRPQRVTLLGVTVGFVGLVILALPGSHGDVPVWGTILIVIASSSWALGSFFSPRLSMPTDPLVATVYESAIAGFVLLALSGFSSEWKGFSFSTISTESWWALAYLVAIGSLVGFTCYVWLLQNAPISLVSTYAYVNPLVAVILGAVILNEVVTGSILLGGAIITAGVAMVVATERPKAAQRRNEEKAPAITK